MKALTVQIPRECCSDGCRCVATHARKLNDFWVSMCDKHVGGTISINKALFALDPKKASRREFGRA
jgi:hypothetical protein